ncbi:hypothetical protein ACDN41_12710 [Priestia aryabhattai]|uniref:hypothetical protein n=1 Tax=Priestia aryabhattai TaxID=412384 RepID=UPI003531D71C
MMASNSYLYDSNGWKTSSRKDVDGTPVMDVYNKGSFVKPVTLQNGATAIGDGTAFDVESYKTLTLEISGTATSHTLVFEGASASGTWYPVQGVRLSDYDMKSQITTKGEVWTFEVPGLVKFRARLSAVAGGNISVKGNAVS